MTAVVEAGVTRRRAPLFAVLAANVLSICGTTMTYLAIPWFVLETTGSPVRTGLVTGVEVAGVVVASVLGGPVIDRLGHRRGSVLSDQVAAVAVTAIPLLYFTSGLPFGVLLVLTAALGLSRAPGDTARAAMLPVLIGQAGTTLQRAAGAYEGVSRTAKGLGAPLAGVLIAISGPPTLLLIDGATFVISAILVSAFVPGGRRVAREPGRSYLGELGAGMAYLRGDRLIMAIVLMVMFTNMLDSGSMAVLFPVYAKDVLHSSVALGLMSGTFGICAAAGTAVYGWIGHRLPNWATYTFAFLLVGSPRYFVLAGQPGLPVILLIMVGSGLLCGVINPVLSVVEMQRIPPDQRAKVIGLVGGGAMAAAPLGAVLAGFAVAGFGLTATLLVTGVLYLLGTLCPLVFPAWREMDPD
jgi:MFS family permease